jgi:hypothetical protein
VPNFISLMASKSCTLPPTRLAARRRQRRPRRRSITRYRRRHRRAASASPPALRRVPLPERSCGDRLRRGLRPRIGFADPARSWTDHRDFRRDAEPRLRRGADLVARIHRRAPQLLVQRVHERIEGVALQPDIRHAIARGNDVRLIKKPSFPRLSRAREWCGVMSCSARDAACCRPECAGCDSRRAREQVYAGCLNFPALRDGGIHSREEVAPDPWLRGNDRAVFIRICGAYFHGLAPLAGHDAVGSRAKLPALRRTARSQGGAAALKRQCF